MQSTHNMKEQMVNPPDGAEKRRESDPRCWTSSLDMDALVT